MRLPSSPPPPVSPLHILYLNAARRVLNSPPEDLKRKPQLTCVTIKIITYSQNETDVKTMSTAGVNDQLLQPRGALTSTLCLIDFFSSGITAEASEWQSVT